MQDNQANESTTKEIIKTPDNDNSETIFAKKIKEYLLTKGGGSSYYVVGMITPSGVAVVETKEREEAAQVLRPLPSEETQIKHKLQIEKFREGAKAVGEAVGIAGSHIVKAVKGS